MELLTRIEAEIRIKYKDIASIIRHKDFIVLTFLTAENGIKDIYKMVFIKEVEGKLKITVYPEKLERVIEVSDLDDIILTIQKQSKPIKHTQQEIQQIKEKYVAGTKIELIKMYDLLAPVEAGTKGIVERVDDIGNLSIDWENGRTLSLVVGVDEFKVLENREEIVI